MTVPAAPPGSEGRSDVTETVYRAIIEACACTLLVLAALSGETRAMSALPFHAAVCAVCAALVIARRLQSRIAMLGLPLVFIHLCSRIDTVGLSLRLPGNVMLPISAILFAVMFLSFVIALLAGEAAEVFRSGAVRALTAAVIAVAVMSPILCALSSLRHRCDWLGVREGVGNAFVSGMLYAVLAEHLSRSRAVVRFGWYVLAFTVVVIVASLAA
jgi:hypothetical protein